VKSLANSDFWACYDRLPKEIQRRADRAYELFLRHPAHPSLRFKALAAPANHYSVRINEKYRAVGVKDCEVVIWFWIGTHNEFDRLF